MVYFYRVPQNVFLRSCLDPCTPKWYRVCLLDELGAHRNALTGAVPADDAIAAGVSAQKD
jgi:hypothetical protein